MFHRSFRNDKTSPSEAEAEEASAEAGGSEDVVEGEERTVGVGVVDSAAEAVTGAGATMRRRIRCTVSFFVSLLLTSGLVVVYPLIPLQD